MSHNLATTFFKARWSAAGVTLLFGRVRIVSPLTSVGSRYAVLRQNQASLGPEPRYEEPELENHVVPSSPARRRPLLLDEVVSSEKADRKVEALNGF